MRTDKHMYILESPDKEFGFYSVLWGENSEFYKKITLAVIEMTLGEQEWMKADRPVQMLLQKSKREEIVMWPRMSQQWYFLVFESHQDILGVLNPGTEVITEGVNTEEKTGSAPSPGAHQYFFTSLEEDKLAQGKHLHFTSTYEICFVFRLT